MAVGFPTKVSYANGDVFSASDINDTNGTINLLTSSTLSVAGGKNVLINGGMDIWQRGTTFNSIANYTADRWVVFPAAGTLNATQSTDVPNSPYFTYSLQIAGVSSTGDILRQRMESAQTTRIAGQTVTLSVYAKSSAGTAALKWNTQVPSVTDNFTTVVQDQSGTFSASPAGTWTRYTATFAVSANAVRGYELRIFRDSSASSNTTLLTGVQIELGSVATSFSRAGGTIQGELDACQRYYVRWANSGGQATPLVFGGTSSAYVYAPGYNKMRTAPSTSTTYTNASYNTAVGAGQWAFGVDGTGYATKTGTVSINLRNAGISFTGATYSATPPNFVLGADATLYMEASAEL